MKPEGLPRTALWLVLLGVSLYCAADEQWGMLVLAGPLAVTGWLLTQRPRAKGLPGWLVGVLVLAFLANAARTAFFAEELAVASAFCQLIIFVLIVKLFERRESRDYAQILMLSAFLCIGALLLSPRLLVAAILVVFLPLLLYGVVQFQFYLAADNVRRATERTRKATSTAFVGLGPARGQRLGRQLAGVVGVMVVVGAVITAAVFIIVPRGAGREFLGDWLSYRAGSVTGFTDTVRLGEGGVISQSSAVVLDLAVFGENEEVLGSPNQVFYLRGAVLEEYENQQWRRADQRSGRGRNQLPDVWFTHGGRSANGRGMKQVITLRSTPSDRMYLFTVWKPVAVRISGSVSNLRHDNRTEMMQVDPPRGRFKYEVISDIGGIPIRQPEDPDEEARVDDDPADAPAASEKPNEGGGFRRQEDSGESQADDGEGAQEEPVRGSRGRRGRESPSRPERRVLGFDGTPIQDLARTVLQTENIDADPAVRPRDQDARAARVIERWLRENCTYSLELRRPAPNEDAIEWFLKPENRTGHCEYFASAMTAMCRSVGIPSRMIAGYVAAEWSNQSQAYTVRESNAHAWVEAEIAPSVWRTFDPTPPSDLIEIHQTEPGIFDRIGRFFDSIEYLWISSFVGFDEEARLRLMGAPSPPAGEQRTFRPAEFRRSLQRSLQAFGLGLATFAAVYLLGRLGLVLWRKNRDRRRLEAADPELARLLRNAGFYGDMLNELRRRGYAKPDWRPPGRHAETIAPADASLASSVRRLTELFYILRFDRRELSTAERAELDALMTRLRASGA